jgi:hypothetical protein
VRQVSGKLQVADLLRPRRQQAEEGVEVLGRGVVRAGRADHVEALETQLGLELAQRINLARDADHGQALEALRARRLEQREQRRVAHLHPAHLRHVGRARHQRRPRTPPIGRITAHRQHRIDRTRLEQTLADACGDAGPLCAGERRLQ